VEEVNGSGVYVPVRGGVAYAEEVYVGGGEYTYPRLVMRGVWYNGSRFASLTLLARLPNITAAYVESGIYWGRGLACYFAVYDEYIHCLDVAGDALSYRRLRFDPPVAVEARQYPLYFLAPPLLALLLDRRRLPYLFLLIAVSAALWVAYKAQLGDMVPSGDDPAIHIYIAMKFVAGETPDFWHSEYPNAVHLLMALMYSVAKSPLPLISFFKLLAFLLVVVGLALYFLYFWLLHRSGVGRRGRVGRRFVHISRWRSHGVALPAGGSAGFSLPGRAGEAPRRGCRRGVHGVAVISRALPLHTRLPPVARQGVLGLSCRLRGGGKRVPLQVA
jgi:hypothetical protein